MLKFLKRTEKTAKSVDEAKVLALSEMGVGEDDVTFTVKDEGAKGFLGIGAKDATVVAEVNDAVVASAKKFLSELFDTMNVQVDLSFNHYEDRLDVDIEGRDLGVVIGKRGDTLDGIQYLTSLVVNSYSDDYVKVTLDAENYREKRNDSLISLADRLASKVAKTGRKHTLEPMNPYERRIIHAHLQSNDKVTTFSVGTDPYRKVVIASKNPRPYKTSYSHSRDYSKKPTIGGYSNGYESTYTPSYDDADASEE